VGVKVRIWKGAWWLFIDHRGKRKAKRVGVGKEGRKAALAAAEQIQARLALGDLSPLERPEPPTPFEPYARRWLRETVTPYRKPRTAEFYRGLLEHHLFPVFGAEPLTAITRARIRELIAAKTQAGLSRLSVRNLVAALRAIFNQAVEDGLLAVNPATRFGRYLQHRQDARAAVAVLTEEEVARLFAAAARWYPEHEVLVRLLFLTGLREGEAFGLQWGDLDLAGGFLEVRRTVDVRGGRWLVVPPKSGRSRRVDLPELLRATLAGFKSLREAEAVVEGREPSPWVFPALQDPSKPLNASWFRRHVWYPLLAKAELRQIRVHDARHTYASLLLQRGEPVGYVKEQLGHASIQMTVDLYGHFIPGANRAAVDRLAAAIEAAQAQLPATPAQPAGTAEEGDVVEVGEIVGAPGVTRTPGTRFRKPLLCPPELRGPADLRGRTPSL